MGKNQSVRSMVAGGEEGPGTPGKLAAGALLYSDTRVYLVEMGERTDGAGIRPTSSVNIVKGQRGGDARAWRLLPKLTMLPVAIGRPSPTLTPKRVASRTVSARVSGR
jgi:hypothetical protein